MDFAGSQAASANTDAFHSAFFHNPYALKVRIKLSRANIVRMGDGMTKDRAFGTDITLHRHTIYSR